MLIGCLINTKYYLIVLINEPGKATISRSIHLFLKNTIVLYTILVKLTFFFFFGLIGLVGIKQSASNLGAQSNAMTLGHTKISYP